MPLKELQVRYTDRRSKPFKLFDGGFRGLASTWANEAQCYHADWIETALAHADENEVRGAYNSAQYLGSRRQMLQDWADLVDGASKGHDVVDAASPIQ